MKKIITMVTAGCLISGGIVCNIKKASGEKTRNKNTSLEKVETLSSPESQEVFSCIDGKGYCFTKKYPNEGLKFKD